MEQILLRKYQLAMQQYQGALDLAFQRTAELEIANVRIAELEARLKEPKEKQVKQRSK